MREHMLHMRSLEADGACLAWLHLILIACVGLTMGLRRGEICVLSWDGRANRLTWARFAGTGMLPQAL